MQSPFYLLGVGQPFRKPALPEPLWQARTVIRALVKSPKDETGIPGWVKEPERSNVRHSCHMSSGTGKAAFVVALLIVAAACSSGGGGRRAASTSSTTIRPVVVPSPSPLGFLSAPYVSPTAAGTNHTATVWNWNGRPQAVMHTGPVIDCCTTVSLSPDGTRLQILYGSTGSEIVDLHGRVLFRSPDVVGLWADDSHHRCVLQPHSSLGNGPDGTSDLLVIDLNGDRQVVGAIGASAGILRCSITANVAITNESSGAGVVGPVSQLQLSTGRVSTPTWLPTTPPLSGLQISGNGDFAAVSQFAGAPTQTDIINTKTGKVVGRVAGSPLAISWDGHVVVERRDQDIAVIDWRSGLVTWHTQPGGSASPNVDVAAREHSDDLALSASSQPGQAPAQAALWLIPSHARARLLDANVVAGII